MHIRSLEGVPLDAGMWVEIEASRLMVRVLISTCEWRTCLPHVPHFRESPHRPAPRCADNLNNYQDLPQ